MELTDLANRILQGHRSSFVQPILLQLDGQNTDEGKDSQSLTAGLDFDSLVQILQSPASSRGVTYFVTGAAGQGKTRLAAEVAAAILRSGTPCLLLKRRDFERLEASISTRDNPKKCIETIAFAFQFRHEVVAKLIDDESIPIVVDGWNEIEERYSDTNLYAVLREIISGTSQFPVLVTSRRQWSENIEDVFYSRSFRTLYLAPFGETEQAIFIRNAGQDPDIVQDYISATGLSEICSRPFFLEQVLLLEPSERHRADSRLRSRSDLMLSALTLRYNEVKSFVLRKPFQLQWPNEQHQAAAVALASLDDERERVNRNTVQHLIATHFPDSISAELTRAFCDIYLLDVGIDDSSDVFLYPHSTLRDFGLALAYARTELPTFSWIASEFEHFIGYWVGLQANPDATAINLIENPHLAESPAIAADIIAANYRSLHDDTRKALWRILGNCLAGRRIVRDAASAAIQGLTREMRVEALSYGMLDPVEDRWPNIRRTASTRILSNLFDPYEWQSITRRFQRARKLLEPAGYKSKVPEDRIAPPRRYESAPEHIRDQLADKDEGIRLSGVMALMNASKTLGVYSDTFELLEPILSDSNSSAKLRAQAMEAIWEAGIVRAMAILRTCLTDRDPLVRSSAAKALGSLHDRTAIPQLVEMIEDGDQQVRVRAIKALGRIRARIAGPQMNAILSNPNEDTEVRCAAAFSIGMMDYWQATSTLIEAIKDTIKDISRVARTALRRIRSEGATTALVAALKDENDSVRITVANVLGEIRDGRSIAALESALMDSNFFVCGSAVTALGHIGRRASSTLPTIIKLLGCASNRWPPEATDDEQQPPAQVIKNRSAAATALGRIGDRHCVETLIGALTDEASVVRGSAATALGRIGDTRAIDGLLLALDDPAADVRGSAAAALGMLKADKAFHALTLALGDAAENVKISAAEALARIRNRNAIPYLSNALTQETVAKVRGAICNALGELGSLGALSILIDRLQNDDAHDVKGSAASALGHIGDSRSLKALVSALNSKYEDVRGSAALALGNIGNKKAVDALIAQFHRDPIEQNKGTIIASLAKLGDRISVPFLIAVLNDPSLGVRVRGKAAISLGYMGDYRATSALLATSNGPRGLSKSSIVALGMLRDEGSLAGLRKIASAENEHPAKRTQALLSMTKIASVGDVDDFIYELAELPADYEQVSTRNGDFLASQALRFIALKGTGTDAVTLLKQICRHDPVPDNRHEAVRGLARLGALDSEIVEYLINPETPGPGGPHTVDRDNVVRGRVCNLLLLEFAGGSKPTTEKMLCLARQLLDPRAESETLQIALSALGYLPLPDAHRAVMAIADLMKIAKQGGFEQAKEFNFIFARWRERINLAKARQGALTLVRASIDEEFSRIMSGQEKTTGQEVTGAIRKVGTFIVVAAKQEQDAVRAYLSSHQYRLIPNRVISNRYADIFQIEGDGGEVLDIGLMLAAGKGKSEMRGLLDALDRHQETRMVIMVGMMAGIKGKVKLLDVVCPRSIFDVTAQGTRDHRIVGEPEPGNFDPKLHNWVANLNTATLAAMSIKLITHKKTVTVAAKIDDVTHELAASALSVDPENIVGLEMEASALTEKAYSQTIHGGRVKYLMIKGVADYAGELPDREELATLSGMVSLKMAKIGDPTRDPVFKAGLQAEATERSLRVALELVRTFPLD